HQFVATLLGGVCRSAGRRGLIVCWLRKHSRTTDRIGESPHHAPSEDRRLATPYRICRSTLGFLPVRRTVMEMVKKVTVSLLDDLDGKAADETVQFALDGVSYEIDLSEKNAKKLRSELQPWVTAGRRTGGSRRRRGVRSASAASARSSCSPT